MTAYDPKYSIQSALRRTYTEPLGDPSPRMHDLAHQLNLLLQAGEITHDEDSEIAAFTEARAHQESALCSGELMGSVQSALIGPRTR